MAAPSSQTPLLSMRGISKRFPGVVALERVNFNLRAGEVHVLLGENGAGKSTLMKILAGAYAKDEGQILLDGQPVEISGPREALQFGISTIYQELNLILSLSVAENIFLGSEPCGPFGFVDSSRQREQAREVLRDLGLAMDPNRPVRDLSVAEQQMVEVAKALSLDSRILIMDEPSSALSRKETDQLFETILRLKRNGVGIIYISHRLEEIFEIGDRVTVLRDGRYIATRPLAEITTPELIHLMANRELKEHFPKEVIPAGKELLRVERLCNRQLRDLSFVLRAGEVLGVSGLMGSGRSELAHALFGVAPIETGRVLVRGKPVGPLSPAKAISQGMGLLTEDRKNKGLILDLSVSENIVLPSTDRLSHHGWLDVKSEESLARHFIRELRIKTPGSDQTVRFLSGGNQQKVVLSKWLACETDILIFDEPTRGIDVAAKVEIYQVINRLAANGKGVIMISSELPEILGMSDRILVMHEGAITAHFTRAEATQERVLSAALGRSQEEVGVNV